MKILLDSCISTKIDDQLIAEGHEAEAALDWPSDPGDKAILAHAHANKQILVTLDKDFGELAIVQKLSHTGIIRLVDISLTQQASICHQVIEKYGGELQDGAIVTAYIDRVRIRSENHE